MEGTAIISQQKMNHDSALFVKRLRLKKNAIFDKCDCIKIDTMI